MSPLSRAEAGLDAGRHPPLILHGLRVTKRNNRGQYLKTSTKIKLSITILWVVISALISANLNEDDDRFRLAGFFTTLTVITFPIILYWLGYWICGGPYIRRPFIWFLAQLGRFVKRAPALQTEQSQQTARGGKLAFAFLLYFAIAIGIASYAYNASTNDVASELGFAAGTLLIPLSIGWAISTRTKGNIAIYISLMISAGFLVNGEWDKINDAYETRLLRHQLSKASQQDALSILLKSDTRLGRQVKSYWADLAGIQSTLNELDDDRLVNAISLDTLRNSNKTAAIAQIVTEKLAFCKTAESKIRDIYNAANSKHQNDLDEIWIGFMNGQREGREVTDPLIHDLVSEYTDAYSALSQLFGILQREAGKYTVPDSGIVTFATPGAVDEFNAALTQFRNAAKLITETRSKLNKHTMDLAAKLKSL